jgi:hypothetical protein
MTSKRWPGIVPAGLVVLAMILLWLVWIGGQVTAPNSATAGTTVSTSSHPDCPEEARV